MLVRAFKEKTPWLFAALGMILGSVGFSGEAWASEASTHFSIFVPPNNSNNGRHSALTVTATTDNTTVSIEDTDEDGDTDDSQNVTLNRGQSTIVRIRDGAVNDGAGGVWDGDRIIIDADKPVTAMLSTRSEWQHDWAPSEGRTMRGYEFFLWSPRPDWEINAVSYEDQTTVEIFEISTSATTGTGTTSVAFPGEIVLRQTIDEGEDLLVSKNRSGTNITREGHTYHVIASQPITVMFGSFYQRERDGGGYVPSENGTTVGTHFYFPVPSGRWQKHEREIRIVAGDTASTVTLRGKAGDTWVDIVSDVALAAYGNLDITGKSHPAVKSYDLYEVVASESINIFEGNWLETGNSGTSDVISYVSALDSIGASDVGKEFVAYLGPPGIQNNVVGHGASFSHLYLTTSVGVGTAVVTDLATGGTIFNETVSITEIDAIYDVRIDQTMFNSLNGGAGPDVRPYLRVSSDVPISVGTANWNDNWLAFASGNVPAELGLSVDHINADVECGTTETYTVVVRNDGEQLLQNVVVNFKPVGEIELLFDQLVVGDLAIGQEFTGQVQGVTECADFSTGELVGVAGTANATGGVTASDIATSQTSMAKVSVPGIVGILELDAEEDNCAIELSWVTDEDTGDVDYQVLRRDFGTQDPFVEIGRIASLAPAASGFVYGYRDITASQGIPYQYIVRARAQSDDSELSTGGPTVSVPGLPFTDIPESTGDIVADYEEAGTVLTDFLNDVTSPWGVPAGYDIDGIAIAYDEFSDSLYLGASAVGILGDGDDDGDPDTSTNSEARGGGTDHPNFSVDEGFAFVLDLDGNAGSDVVVGIPFGSDLDFLQATQANPSFVDTSPTLAFTTPSAEESGSIYVELINKPSASAPDLELVIRNVSVLNDGNALANLGVAFYLTASSVANEAEWAPAQALTTVTAESVVTAGCGARPQQIHLGTFAAFGNAFSGTPDFAFLPMGWNRGDGEVLAVPPEPAFSGISTSPTIFLGEKHVDVAGTFDLDGLNLARQDVVVLDEGNISGDDYLHVSELSWDFSEADGEERYENIDLQVFRLFVLDCSATVIIKQLGTSGVLRDDRNIRLADNSVTNLGDISPASTLAHSGLGTFETGGAIQRLHFGIPEDWVNDFGAATAPEFTHYAFLDDVSYLGNTVVPDTTDVYPLGESGQQIEAGIWFVNHYLWTYANEGATRIETRFIPGEDCGGSL